jgi:hypothetical protein
MSCNCQRGREGGREEGDVKKKRKEMKVDLCSCSNIVEEGRGVGDGTSADKHCSTI